MKQKQASPSKLKQRTYIQYTVQQLNASLNWEHAYFFSSCLVWVCLVWFVFKDDNTDFDKARNQSGLKQKGKSLDKTLSLKGSLAKSLQLCLGIVKSIPACRRHSVVSQCEQLTIQPQAG